MDAVPRPDHADLLRELVHRAAEFPSPVEIAEGGAVFADARARVPIVARAPDAAGGVLDVSPEVLVRERLCAEARRLVHFGLGSSNGVAPFGDRSRLGWPATASCVQTQTAAALTLLASKPQGRSS